MTESSLLRQRLREAIMADPNSSEGQREWLRPSRSWTDFPRHLHLQNPIVAAPSDIVESINDVHGDDYVSIVDETAPWTNLSSLLPPLLVPTAAASAPAAAGSNRLRRSPGVPNLRELFEEEEEWARSHASGTCMPSSFSYGELR